MPCMTRKTRAWLACPLATDRIADDSTPAAGLAAAGLRQVAGGNTLRFGPTHAAVIAANTDLLEVS